GDLWIVTRGGVLDRYDASTGYFTQYPDSIFQNAGILPTGNLVQVNDSLLLFSDGPQVGVFNFQNQNCKTFQAPGYVRGIEPREENVLIYGDFGIYSYNLAEGTDNGPLPDPETIIEVPCHHLTFDGAGWYALTREGISRFRSGLQSEDEMFLFDELDLPVEGPSSISSFAVRDSVFWLGGNELLARIFSENDSWKAEEFEYDPSNDFSFKGHQVTALEFDRLGNLWIGTLKNGLNLFNKEKNLFSHYTWSSQSLMSPDADPVRAICKTRDGDIWLGFDRRGVGIIEVSGDHQYFSHYFDARGVRHPIHDVRTVFQDRQENIWIGEEGQLCLYNPELGRIESVDVRFSWNWPFRCYSVKEFDRGEVVVTAPSQIGFVDISSGEIDILDLEKFDFYAPGSVRDIVRDQKGTWWVAKDEHGVMRIDPHGGGDHLQESGHGLSDNKVYSMSVVGDSLWLGTNSGLNLFSIREDTVTARYFEADGLSNNIVYSVYQDQDEHLWMSTNRGISRFNPDAEKFRTYLVNDFFMDDAHFADAKGRLYYGGYTGILAFYPEEIRMKDFDVHVSLENFRLFNEKVVPGDSVDGRVLFDEALDETSEIRLKHHQNSFSFEFNGYPFDYPNHNRYRYRLKGLQEEWIYSDGTSRQAAYSVVPPGEYVFEAQAAPFQSEFGPVTSLKITVVPPFWQTTWFKLLLLIMLLGAVWGGYQVRSRQIRKRNILLKTRVNEQTRALQEQNRQIVEMSDQLHQADQSKLRFFTNVSHDFRTPLTLILAQLDQLHDQGSQAVKSIRNNAHRLLRLINQLIDLRKLDQGQMKLSIARFDMVAFTSGIVMAFDALALQKNIDLSFSSPVETLDVWLDRDKMEKILYNLLGNAIKYTPEGKSVKVSLYTDPESLTLEVEDEGIGFPAGQPEQIFDRFYRSGNGRNLAPGDGIGLSIVKGLTDVQKGSVVAESSENGGARFKLTFPLGKHSFKEVDVVIDDIYNDVHDSVSFVGPEQEVRENGAAEETPSLQSFDGQRVLVVEDNEELSGFLKNTLEKHFVVETSANGREALDLLTRFNPALIISDIMMPVMDGIEFCRQLKADLQTSHIPVILLTARVDAETHIEGFELGVDDYIEKPFDARVLLARLKALLENREKLRQYFEAQNGRISSDVALSERDRTFLGRVEDEVLQQYPDPAFNVEKLSEMMAMSRSSFYRKFKDLTGMTAANYIRKVRLQKAASLLNQQTISVAQVSEEVGFQSVAHFRKCFRDEYGTTPGAWNR
ncbi:MAG: response regulator, partial [Marinilabiliaceae bacterium]